MSLKSFFANTFKHLFGEPTPAAPIARPTRAKSAPVKRPARSLGNGYWVKRQMQDYDGKGVFIVSVPANLSMKQAQSSVCSHMGMRFGVGTYTTRRYSTARTIHVRPL